MKIDYNHFFRNCEVEIRMGRPQKVAVQLSQLNTSKIPTNHRLTIANLCRRVGSIGLGLRILSPVVRPTGARRNSNASPAELAEYAALLSRKGAVREAAHLLESIDSSSCPESLLYRSFCLFSEWNYTGAVPVLQQFIESEISPYTRLVGNVNLAAALIGSENFTSARQLVLETLPSLLREDYRRLQGNCLELLAQIELFEGRLTECQRHLQVAESLLASTGVDKFFVSKWQAIHKAFATQDIQPLVDLRERAHNRCDWETQREADRHLLKIQFDTQRFNHLIFGTPFSAYRERLLRQFDVKPEESFLFGQSDGEIIDLVSGDGLNERAIRGGNKCLELIEVLSRDFYRPQNLGSLFSHLYPNEYFDIFSSPSRVYQLVFRARQFLECEQLPLTIIENTGGYSLMFTGPLQLRVPFERRNLAGYRFEYENLLRILPSNQFKASEGRRLLDMPRTTFQRFCAWGVQSGLIERNGSGPSTTYILKQRDKIAS